MKLLVDTHAFLWWAEGAPALGKKAEVALSDARNHAYLSIVSCWELAIKLGLGKLRVDESLEQFIPKQLALNGFKLLGLEIPHVARLASLPFRHRDPFDRLLVAQAIEERLTIVTAERAFRKYDVSVVW
jgi:PIN domain nuclease of toxin-antitoxin system